MNILPRDLWSPAQTLSVARLIVDPATNGGIPSDVDPELVALHLPDAPAWAVFEGDRASFVVGLNPFQWNPEMTRMRGILHVAGDKTVPGAWQIIRSFLRALPGVEVFTYHADPRMIRLAQWAGLQVLGKQDGLTILGR